MQQLRLSLIGFGTVGRSFAELLATKSALLRKTYDVEVTLVSVANARHGFIYREDGLDISTLLELAMADRSLSEYPGIHYWEFDTSRVASHKCGCHGGSHGY